MEDINNNEFDEIDVIRNNTDACKVEFVSTVISQKEIPFDFKKIGRTNEEKIFFEIKNGKKQKREWVLFPNNKFYCVYCLCFSPLHQNRLVLGVEYVNICRITDKIKNHGLEAHHKAAKNTYSEIVACFEKGAEACTSGKKNAIRCIVKIIIFVATHGQYLSFFVVLYSLVKHICVMYRISNENSQDSHFEEMVKRISVASISIWKKITFEVNQTKEISLEW